MKRLSFSIILILLIIAASDMPQARVKGVCSDCHTMHNSQAGDYMAQTLTLSESTWGFADDETPNPSLLIRSCVGCHTNVDSDATKLNGVPIVFNPSGTGPADPLAGGNFYYVMQDQANGHNVTDITGYDTAFNGKKIPGSTTTYGASVQVTCAGEFGCHGNRSTGNDELAGIRGAHHTDDTVGITGNSVGLSYRFLAGIEGVEDDDYEQETVVDKNYYKGANNSDADDATISYLCNNCHGDFHDRAKISDESTAATPWLRHPTDYLLPTDGEYGNYDPTSTYENKAPVAWTNLSNRIRSTAVVMCLSCHRAHGSPYYKMIRWNYKSTTLSDALYGCSKCHTSKN